MQRVFLSYRFADEPFVQEVNYLLKKQPDLETFFYAQDRRTGRWLQQLMEELRRASGFVLFLGSELGATQSDEWTSALTAEREHHMDVLVVNLSGSHELPELFHGRDPVLVPAGTPAAPLLTAREIVTRLGLSWVADDGLPHGYLFAHEKDIIDEYAANNGVASTRYIEEGAPPRWPQVEHQAGTLDNPVPEHIIGRFRKPSAGIFVDARTDYPTPAVPKEGSETAVTDPPPAIAHRLAFPEAGPRAKLSYPRKQRRSLNVGVVVSGGIAPGINSVISGIVGRHRLYEVWQKENRRHSYDVLLNGYVEGFRGLMRGDPPIELDEAFARERASLGGSLLGTSRAEELLPTTATPRGREEAIGRVINRLVNDRVDILYVIGGDGSMRAAHALWTRARSEDVPLSVAAIPKTMDNDILWVWQSFGFYSTVEKAKEVLVQLSTEAMANPRLCIVQLFGSNSGFVVTHAALASGVCDLILTPETEFASGDVCEYVKERLRERLRPRRRLDQPWQRPHGIIAMAETAIPKDVERFLYDKDAALSDAERDAVRGFVESGRRVFGQTPDPLRSAGLKIVATVLKRAIESMEGEDTYWEDFRVFWNEPRHLIRSIPPSAGDVIFGHRLGALAVDCAMAGYTDFMISQWLTEYVVVPLKLVVLGRKRVPLQGFFWKTVIANTGQPERLDTSDTSPEPPVEESH